MAHGRWPLACRATDAGALPVEEGVKEPRHKAGAAATVGSWPQGEGGVELGHGCSGAGPGRG